MFTIYALFKAGTLLSLSRGLTPYKIIAGLLIVNALAVLHPQRFLRTCTSLGSTAIELCADARCSADGLDTVEGQVGLKHQIAGLLHATRFLRVPLIAVNVVSIKLKAWGIDRDGTQSCAGGYFNRAHIRLARLSTKLGLQH
jgi:hypothetical protein